MGDQAATIRAYLMDNPLARTRDVASAIGCTDAAVSFQKRRVLMLVPYRQHEADKRRIPPRDLDALILRAVYEGKLIDAVLDDAVADKTRGLA